MDAGHLPALNQRIERLAHHAPARVVADRYGRNRRSRHFAEKFVVVHTQYGDILGNPDARRPCRGDDLLSPSKKKKKKGGRARQLSQPTDQSL